MNNQLSLRASTVCKTEDFLADCFSICQNDQWDSKTNSNGYINLGTGENYLCRNLVADRFNQSNFYEYNEEVQRYYDYSGIDCLKESFIAFAKHFFAADDSVEKQDVMMVNGTGSALDMIAHCIADAGDCLLCPAPYYSRIRNVCYDRARVEIISVNLPQRGSESFVLDVSLLKATYQQAIIDGHRVKGIIILNPSNPLGIVYDKLIVMEILKFAATLGLYVIIDEIYGLSVFDGVSFESVLSYGDELPDAARTIWVWGLSKDFGQAGLRVSFIHVRQNAPLRAALERLVPYQCVPHFMHIMLTKLLNDHDWIHFYLNEYRQRLHHNYQIVCNWLRSRAIPFVTNSSGSFFVFADFGKYCEEDGIDGGERELFENIFYKNKVYVVPGQTLNCTRRGWFRLCFTVVADVLQEGLVRLGNFFDLQQK